MDVAIQEGNHFRNGAGQQNGALREEEAGLWPDSEESHMEDRLFGV